VSKSEALAVVIEAARDVHARRQTELRERRSRRHVLIGELAVDEIRLVERDQH
jgi:hypothetical protein